MPEQPQQIILAFFQGCELMDAAVDEVAVLRHIEVAAGCFQLLLDQPEFFFRGKWGFDGGTGLSWGIQPPFLTDGSRILYSRVWGKRAVFIPVRQKSTSGLSEKRLKVLLHAKRRANNKPSSVFDNNLSNPYVAIRLKPPHRNTTGRRIVPVGCCFG